MKEKSKTWTDLGWNRLATRYAIEDWLKDTAKSKYISLLIGFTVVNVFLTIINWLL